MRNHTCGSKPRPSDQPSPVPDLEGAGSALADRYEGNCPHPLSPPEHAVVFCVDEKSQIQVLDRTQLGLPMKKGRRGTMTHDYKRNGTATLFAALNTLDGTVISMCDDRHRHQEWLKFLSAIDDLTPEAREIHLIADNRGTLAS